MTALCDTSLWAHLVGQSSWTALPVTLHYRATDPFEVTITIGTDNVQWKLSRELLQAGTEQPAGEGDVRLWPCRQDPRDHLFLHLCPPTGQALLELPRMAVLDFLRKTEMLVPTGTEAAAFSIDAEMKALLDDDPS